MLRIKQTARNRALPQNEANHYERIIANFVRLAIYIAGAAMLFATFTAPAGAGFAGNNYVKSLRAPRAHKAAPGKIMPAWRQRAPERKERTETIPVSLSGMARGILPAGVYRASGEVTTSCFNARMINLLSTIQRKYRRPLIITSGYRGYLHNISAGGVRGSLHTACAAADIKIPGVNKYQLASYVRSLPNRGGVGLYCHDAVHVDIGSRREWNWCAAAGKHPRARHHRHQLKNRRF